MFSFSPSGGKGPLGGQLLPGENVEEPSSLGPVLCSFGISLRIERDLVEGTDCRSDPGARRQELLQTVGRGPETEDLVRRRVQGHLVLDHVGSGIAVPEDGLACHGRQGKTAEDPKDGSAHGPQSSSPRRGVILVGDVGQRQPGVRRGRQPEQHESGDRADDSVSWTRGDAPSCSRRRCRSFPRAASRRVSCGPRRARAHCHSRCRFRFPRKPPATGV